MNYQRVDTVSAVAARDCGVTGCDASQVAVRGSGTMSPPSASRSRPEPRFYAWEIFLFNWRTLHSGSSPGGTGETAEKCGETIPDTYCYITKIQIFNCWKIIAGVAPEWSGVTQCNSSEQ